MRDRGGKQERGAGNQGEKGEGTVREGGNIAMDGWLQLGGIGKIGLYSKCANRWELQAGTSRKRTAQEAGSPNLPHLTKFV